MELFTFSFIVHVIYKFLTQASLSSQEWPSTKMEKFSAWRDKGTGIAPFIPLSEVKSPLQKYVVGPLLVTIKFPFFMILYWLSLFAPKFVIETIFSRVLGFSIDLLVAEVRKLNRIEIYKAQPDINTIVVSNFASPLDIFVIYLTSKVSSLSSIAVVIPIDNALYVLSAWDTVKLCFQPIGLKCGAKLTSQNESRLRNKLVVVFAEGTTSNNSAVLSLSPVVESIFSLRGYTYQTTLLLWNPKTVSIPIPVMTPSQYLMKLFSMSSRPLVKVKIVPHSTGSLKNSKAAFKENGINIVDLGVADKRQFFEYYQS